MLFYMCLFVDVQIHMFVLFCLFDSPFCWSTIYQVVYAV